MLRLTGLYLPLDHASDAIAVAVRRQLKLAADAPVTCHVFRRGVDARRRGQIRFVYTVDVDLPDEPAVLARVKDDKQVAKAPDMTYRFLAKAPAELTSRPIVIGTGPCGMFAGLLLAQMGFRPIILERGKAVRERTGDTWDFWRHGKLHPESNVQFGEGGAGTFSDGKLYSQVKDPRYLGRKVLREFVDAGAPPEILYVAKPHIGTFRLVGIVQKLRAATIALGGEVRFEQRVDDLLIDDGNPGGQERGQERGVVRGVVLEGGERIESDHVVLAVGHSARDTFEMLHRRGVYIEPKPFSIGFRVEHPQAMIDRCRLGNRAGDPQLGAADYKLVHHCGNGRSVYTFCMCPGGTVVASASEPGGVVTNGMSQYSRNERNANSGIVVGITPEDFPGVADNPLAGMEFQRKWERRAFEAGGGTYDAPGQLIGDFLAGRPSTKLGSVEPSYIPAVRLGDLSSCLPDYAIAAIREAIPALDKQMPGFAMSDAVLTGVETRTSSPIRIKRNEQYQSMNTAGLYPAGEGAGYAGGILSAAIDGIKVAEAVALHMTGHAEAIPAGRERGE